MKKIKQAMFLEPSLGNRVRVQGPEWKAIDEPRLRFRCKPLRRIMRKQAFSKSPINRMHDAVRKEKREARRLSTNSHEAQRYEAWAVREMATRRLSEKHGIRYVDPRA